MTAPQPGTPEFEAAITWSTGEDERHVARTDDGWNLALYRYRAATPSHPHPVVMGHGLCGSHYIFDVHDQCSMARALAARGFDVWLVDLRGRGESWPDGGPDLELQWTFDDFVFHDVPAAVERVAELAGTHEVWWLGTEMSGIAYYAVGISRTAPRIRGGITLGSPAVTPTSAEIAGVTTPFPERSGARYPFSMASEIGPLLAVQRSDVLESSFRPVNTDWRATARYFRYGVPDESTAIVDQFKDWIAAASMRSVDGSVVWSDRLGEVVTPTLLLAGSADRQRPIAAVEQTFRALGAADKTFVRADGFGHDDLLAGLRSPAEVYPLLANWLTERT